MFASQRVCEHVSTKLNILFYHRKDIKNILKLPLEIIRKLDTEKNGPKYLFFKVDNISGRKRKHRLKLFDQND